MTSPRFRFWNDEVPGSAIDIEALKDWMSQNASDAMKHAFENEMFFSTDHSKGFVEIVVLGPEYDDGDKLDNFSLRMPLEEILLEWISDNVAHWSDVLPDDQRIDLTAMRNLFVATSEKVIAEIDKHLAKAPE